MTANATASLVENILQPKEHKYRLAKLVECEITRYTEQHEAKNVPYLSQADAHSLLTHDRKWITCQTENTLTQFPIWRCRCLLSHRLVDVALLRSSCVRQRDTLCSRFGIVVSCERRIVEVHSFDVKLVQLVDYLVTTVKIFSFRHPEGRLNGSWQSMYLESYRYKICHRLTRPNLTSSTPLFRARTCLPRHQCMTFTGTREQF